MVTTGNITITFEDNTTEGSGKDKLFLYSNAGTPTQMYKVLWDTFYFRRPL